MTYEINTIKEAAGEAKKLVKMLSAVAVISDAFEKVVSMDNLVHEIEGRLAGARAAEEAERAKLDAVKVLAKQTLLDADNEAASTRFAARAKADEILAEAEERRVKVEGEVSMSIGDAAALEATLEAEIANHKEVLANVSGLITDRSEELRALEDKIAAAKDAIQQLLK